MSGELASAHKRQDKAKYKEEQRSRGCNKKYPVSSLVRTTPARPRFIKYIDNTTKHLGEGRDDVTYILNM